MKVRNIEGSVYDKGNGELQLWGISFIIPGQLYRDADGKIPESARNKVVKQIKKALAELEFPNEEVYSTDD
jgi:hypothetical protein